MLFNYHTHTKRCGHANGEDEEYVEKAIQNGVKTLGFSDHAPYFYPDCDGHADYQMKTEHILDYAESVRALAKKYKDDIRILCGFELEYYPDYHEEEKAFLSQVSPDYLLLGQHFIGNGKNTPHTNNQGGEETATAYASQVIAGLATGDFLYLAHPDMLGWNRSRERAEWEYRRICRYAKKKNIPLEINLLGLATNRVYPSRAFFQIAAEEKNRVIIGVDAHWPSAFTQKEAEAQALNLVRELGLELIDKPLL